MLRSLVRGGQTRKSSISEIDLARSRAKTGDKSAWDDISWGFNIPMSKVYELTRMPKIAKFVCEQQDRWISHILRRPNTNLSKQLVFLDESWSKGGNRRKTVFEVVIERASAERGQSVDAFIKEARKPLLSRQSATATR